MNYDKNVLNKFYNGFLHLYQHVELYRVQDAIELYSRNMKDYLYLLNPDPDNPDPDNPECWSGAIDDPYIQSINIFCHFLDETVAFNKQTMSSESSTRYRRDLTLQPPPPQRFICPANRLDDIIQAIEKDRESDEIELNEEDFMREPLSDSQKENDPDIETFDGMPSTTLIPDL